MESGFWLLVIFGVMIGLVVLNELLVGKKLSSAVREYKKALADSEEDPNNPDLQKAAWQRGRTLVELRRALGLSSTDPASKLFDETAIRNDIDAATAGRADKIRKLAMLTEEGVITPDERESLKSQLATKPSGVQDVIRLLKGLKELEKEGVLTESEFKMKKWEILSRRILRD